jgi:hypothetical protein
VWAGVGGEDVVVTEDGRVMDACPSLSCLSLSLLGFTCTSLFTFTCTMTKQSVILSVAPSYTAQLQNPNVRSHKTYKQT